MIVICWNCRGLGNPRTVHILRHWCRRFLPDMVFLSETMCSRRNVEDLRIRFGFANAFGVSSVGNSGGLCLFWREGLDFNLESYSAHHIIGKIVLNSGLSWDFCGFYGWPNHNEKHLSWDLLRSLTDNRGRPMLIGGDFNEILKVHEKQGGSNSTPRHMGNFSRMVNDTGLIDLGCSGDPFTWERGKTAHNRIKERLDRFLGSASWLSLIHI